ncbi:uromodulin-like [Trematomus bernacchii]|uniref:uromodulin-like n=1 Tax=Trematomus bernacchii TaxID=40690 RepID=UPI00146E55B3|nr:uromodulin-like [Trematomus bernacchii]
MTLYFDGNTAHVSGIEAMEGLCGSPLNSTWTTTPIAEKTSSFSPPGCEIQQQDTIDSSINCNSSTDHCNLMRQPPFSACHEHTDPEPFISACTHTLCRYPSVDGVDCHFLEAYAKACSLEANVTLEDWRSTSGCSPPPLCQQPCSDHEFCGAEMWSSSRCFCRAGFASKYRATKSLGEPPVCRQGSATVTLAGCLLADKGIDFSTLHLKDPSCKGHMDPQSNLVTFSFDSSNTCGTEVMKNGSQIVYENSIVSSNRSSAGVITRQDQLKIDFSCFYKQLEVKSVSFTIRDSSVVQQLVSGVWNYTLTMKAFSDAGLLQPVGPNTEILLNQKVWLQLEAGGLDANMVAMVTDSCWATNQASPDDSLRYDLIINGCPNPADDTVQMQGNGQGTSSVFSFNMFEFSGASSEIYLHCKLELCPTQGQACAPSCGGGARRRRRSARFAEGNAALITMAWSN